ncbi:hypothetical protein [Solirubrobacter ginsenosidimutans]|uniref:hypothetical protein n=1 Tax=Solirubrobacter ginsenosidimutans TaxID=490573 RepID=UPI0022CDE69C|nr:hypothetical protein [Solirubrobacter ginsenosidimutans]
MRVAIYAMWLLVVVPDPLAYLADLAPGAPVGVFRWLPDALVTSAGLGALKVALVVVLVVCLVGAPGYRVWAVVASALLTVQQALLREYTFVNHEELALLVCTWVLVLFPAADGCSWPRRAGGSPGSHALALEVLTAFFVLPYTLIAAHRLAYAAPDVFTGESLPYWLASLNSLDRDGWGVGVWALGHPALVDGLKVGFFVTTVFELLAPLCLVSRSFTLVWVAVVAGFHVVNEFTLNLFFWQNAVLALLLVGWSRGARFRR